MRNRWKPRWDELSDTGHENFVIDGVRATVKAETGGKYLSAVGHYIAFIDARRLPYSRDSFRRFLHACRKQGASGSTLSGYRAALLWLQRAYNVDTWADSDEFTRPIKGYKYADKIARPPRGAILRTMLSQLGTRHPDLALPANIAYFCVLRRRQVEKALVGDVQVLAGGRVILTLRAEKRANASNDLQPTVTRKEIVLPEGQTLLTHLARGRNPKEKLLPGFKAEALDKAVADAAQYFAWPTGLVYDGMHCLRHGGAQELRDFFSRLFASMGNPAAMSPVTAGWYSRLNELRVAAEKEEAQALVEEEEEGEI